ncbi:hypothetical protein ACOSQ4_020941 [Xanthoceras sorbifolium]
MSTHLDDPLEGYSGLTLFPRTLASIPNAPKPSDPDDLRHVNNFLKSMQFQTLQSPNKFLEQAKAIIDSCSELPNSTISSSLTSEDQIETAAAKMIKNLPERRPALGRKRARFSLKPNSSQPTASLEPILDMDKLKDPEEFFLAFEKHENAKRELQKQTGGILMDLNQQNPSKASRPRRPGLLGRSVKYKHHYSNDISSQETFKENILGPIDCSVQRETTNLDAASEQMESEYEPQETKLADSVAKAENRVNELLDELLTGNYELLDGDGTVTLLQEHLQIKPIDIEKLCLPDLHDVRRFDLKAKSTNLPKPRSALSDIHNVLKGLSSRTPKISRHAESSVVHLASPTPPKSPLDSIISLKKRILQSNSLNDPFSSLHLDQSPARNASPFGSIKEQTAQGNMDMKLSSSLKLKSQMTEENDIADMNVSVPEVAIGDFGSPNKTMDDNLRLGSGIYVGSSGSTAYLHGNIGGSCSDSRVVNETSDIPNTDADDQTNELNELDDKMQDTLKEAVDSVQPALNTEDPNEPNELDDRMEDTLMEAAESVQPGLNMEDSTVENLNTQSQLEQANPAVVKEHAVDAPSKTADTGSEQHNEKAQIPTKEPLHEQNKATLPREKRKRKEVSRRQSLAAFGTTFESGIRRSTRIRSRPLEYWRGERFLYGRVNNSLATVIGIKYESPAKEDGKPALKVKSFVSDQYQDLVEQAARF